MSEPDVFDLVIVGGGINGCGIAADAASRGLRVLLVEASDLGSGTSSGSSKLIHGGLRYLEHYEFRLVREALAEREVLLAKAPHIIWPLRFVLPHVPGLRPAWMIRSGLFLYDHLARRRAIPGSKLLDLRRDPAGQPLRADLKRGFEYWDCWVDDARLVVLNARAAAANGCQILTRSRVTGIHVEGQTWRVRFEAGNVVSTVEAKAVVNAAGPWAGPVGACIEATNAEPHLRLVKGSHVVVPRIAGATSAYLMQNADGRVVFALPFEEQFTLIGTTDVPFTGDAVNATCSPEEECYLLALAAEFFRVPIRPEDIVWRYAGVRPLYDDRSSDPSAVTRDYHLDLNATAGQPPLLTVLGGKVTTYRRLAEEALDRLAPFFPGLPPGRTAKGALPGGDIPGGDLQRFVIDLHRRLPALDASLLARLARRYGTQIDSVLDGATTMPGLGQHLGGGLTEREVAYLKQHEWARLPDDVLWRRTKAGLHMTATERASAATAIARLLA